MSEYASAKEKFDDSYQKYIFKSTNMLILF